MRRLIPFALLVSASALPAQSIWNSSVRSGPQFFSYQIGAPFNEKVSQIAVPMFAIVPIMSNLTVDVGTAFASAHYERETVDTLGNPVTETSDISGLTDTQVRANWVFGQDFLVLTAGVNLPTGSAMVTLEQFSAATRIGSDFLTFPISGFGSGMSATAGLAVAQPLGSWNVGLGASYRHAMEYDAFRDAQGDPVAFQPGPEYRARVGVDRPFGTGRISVGFTYSKFGDDRANAAVFNTGDRYIGQFAVSNSLTDAIDYSFVIWNLYRTSGTLINQSASPSGNITNAMMIFGMRAGPVALEPSIETRLWTQEGSTASALGTFGLRLFVNRSSWAIVPGGGFTIGTMDAATLTGFRGTLAIRIGG